MRRLSIVLLFLSFFRFGIAQTGAGYQLPAKGVADLLLAKPTPAVSIDNKGEWMLLSESHSYTAKENLLHLLYERGQWLDKHVKNAEPRLTGF